eukprot:2905744-Rhodomonas_salina.1
MLCLLCHAFPTDAVGVPLLSGEPGGVWQRRTDKTDRQTRQDRQTDRQKRQTQTDTDIHRPRRPLRVHSQAGADQTGER